MKRLGPILLCALFLLTACGKFSSKDASDATTIPEIGGGLNVPTSPTHAPTTTSTTTKAKAPGATTADDLCPTKAPSSEITYENRVKIAMKTSRTCAAHKDDITFTMTVTNVSKDAVHYDANQLLRFTVRAPASEQKHRWEDDDCVTAPSDRNKKALTLNAGEGASFTSVYPGPVDFAQRETCRKLDTGLYEVHGVFLVCDESYQDGYCDITKDTQYQGDPIRITLSA